MNKIVRVMLILTICSFLSFMLNTLGNPTDAILGLVVTIIVTAIYGIREVRNSKSVRISFIITRTEVNQKTRKNKKITASLAIDTMTSSDVELKLRRRTRRRLFPGMVNSLTRCLAFSHTS